MAQRFDFHVPLTLDAFLANMHRGLAESDCPYTRVSKPPHESRDNAEMKNAKGTLTKPGMQNHEGRNDAEYTPPIKATATLR
jgi:hypothetical protein